MEGERIHTHMEGSQAAAQMGTGNLLDVINSVLDRQLPVSGIHDHMSGVSGDRDVRHSGVCCQVRR